MSNSDRGTLLLVLPFPLRSHLLPAIAAVAAAARG